MTITVDRSIALLVSFLGMGLLLNNTGSAQPPVKAQSPDPPRSGATSGSKSPFPSRSEGVHPSLAHLKNRVTSTAVFIENVGQFDPRVLYQAKIGEQTAWLTTDGIVFDAIRPRYSEQATATPTALDGFTNRLGQLFPSIAPDRARRGGPQWQAANRVCGRHWTQAELESSNQSPPKVATG
jgi:hypothetical protein